MYTIKKRYKNNNYECKKAVGIDLHNKSKETRAANINQNLQDLIPTLA